MKKRILILLCVLALLTAVCVLSVSAGTQDIDFSSGGTVTAVCPHCGGEAVNWLPLTQTLADTWRAAEGNYDPANGTHYYVSDDTVSFNYDKTMSGNNGDLTVAAGETLCLHLNGKTLTRNSQRTVTLNGTLNLMDHAANAGVLSGKGGTSSSGCAIRMNSAGSEFHMYGGMLTLTAGTAAKGGCLYMAGGTATISGGTVSGGKATHGGNIYVNSGSLEISGTARITGGTATGSGGNIYANANGDTAFVKLSGGTVSGGTAGNYGGNVYAPGRLILGGDVTVCGGSAETRGSGLYISGTGTLEVASDFTGAAKVAVSSANLPTPILGGAFSKEKYTCQGPFTGKLYLENHAALPTLYGVEGDTALYVADTALVKQDGTQLWYSSSTEALTAYDSTVAYMVTGASQLVLTGGVYTVDLAGADLALTGTGTVTLFDSANKDYATYGTATVTGVSVANEFETEVQGTKYYMVREDTKYSFHCLSMALTGVNIRPASSGIYYTGNWSCDDKLATLVDSFGVAVSLRGVPTADFAEDDSCLYTEFGPQELESGVSRNGVIIEGILEAANSACLNDRNGRKLIYASAYLKLTDGTTFVSGEGAGYSLYRTMTRLNALIGQDPASYAEERMLARQFYQSWADDGMETWTEDLHNILARVEDGVLDLLMVGNSFCYYYVEELYELLMEAPPEGITEVNIYNLYHSGCRIDTHYEKWVANEAYYDLYKTDADGRRQLGADNAWTLEEALKQADWDFISLQGMPTGGSYTTGDMDAFSKEIAGYAEPLLDRFHDLYPHAQLLWHRTWFFEIGRVSGGYTYKAEDGPLYDAGMQQVCDYMCSEFDRDKPYDLVMVNTGAAWTRARARDAALETGLLPFGGLCARLGYSAYGENLAGYEGDTANSGDGYHDGDIGGGQLLNAYAWYETLTGSSCVGTAYRPTYGSTHTLSEDLVKLLQEAAHDTVSEMPETVQPAA